MEKIWYDEEEDILNIQLKDSGYWKSVELSNGMMIDIAKDGSFIGIEVLKASKLFLGDAKKVIEKAKLVTA